MAFNGTPAVTLRPNVVDGLLSLVPLLRIAEEVQLAKGPCSTDGMACGTLLRFRPLMIARGAQIEDMKAFPSLATNAP
jgi:hypothetical protein